MLEDLLLLITATAVMLGSPGPAPLSLAASGAAFGARRSAPFLAGILTGLLLVAALAAVGVGPLIAQGGLLTRLLFGVSLLYFGYVAWKIAFQPALAPSEARGKAPTLADGFVLNITNPKAYAAFAALYAGFSLPIDNAPLRLSATGAVSFFIAVLVDSFWLLAGGAAAPLFGKPKTGRVLRICLAVLMLGAVAISIAAAMR